jgi:hypothetical protein
MLASETEQDSDMECESVQDSGLEEMARHVRHNVFYRNGGIFRAGCVLCQIL